MGRLYLATKKIDFNINDKSRFIYKMFYRSCNPKNIYGMLFGLV